MKCIKQDKLGDSRGWFISVFIHLLCIFVFNLTAVAPNLGVYAAAMLQWL